jgi:hypothetical protein
MFNSIWVKSRIFRLIKPTVVENRYADDMKNNILGQATQYTCTGLINYI